MRSNFPLFKDHELYMGGDKVKEKLSGDIFRVKARFAIGWVDYITLQNIDSGNEITVAYYDVIDKLSLVNHPVRPEPNAFIR